MQRAQLVCLAAAAIAAPQAATASYGVYVGKELTASGHVLIGGTGEEVSSHWLELVPGATHPEGATLTVGVTGEANIPGERFEIPQAPRTARYLATFYTEFRGFPPPLVNGGLNEHRVAVRDIWSPSRAELVEMTPTPQRGLSYSDLARIVMERAHTAREGVELIGELIAENGFATYGGNSHLIADPNEGWVVIQFAGGAGLWVAERLGPRDIRVSFPGYIGEIPLDFVDHPDYMGSPHLVDFAIEHGYFDPEAGEPFNVHEVYGLQGVPIGYAAHKFVDSLTLEDELRELAPEIRLQDIMAWVRDPRIAHEEAGYGHVAQLRPDVEAELGLLWAAPTSSVTAPFIPYHLGVTRISAEYRQHRYLTKDASRTFLSPDYQLQEATEFAGRVFKRLMYYTCERPERFLPEVVEALEAFEARMIASMPALEAKAETLFAAGERELASELLTRSSEVYAAKGLRLGHALLGSIEARTKLLFGIREPETDQINEPAVSGRDTISCVTSVDYDEPVIGQIERSARPPALPEARAPTPAEGASKRSSRRALGLAFALGLLPGLALFAMRRRP